MRYLIPFLLACAPAFAGLSFPDDAANYIEGGDLTIASGSVSVSAWAYQDVVEADNHEIIDMPSTAANGATNYGLSITESGDVRFNMTGSDEVTYHRYTSTSPPITATTWHGICVKYTFGTGSSIKMYVDGSEVTATWTTGDGDELPNTGTDNIIIGAYDVAGITNPFNGDLAHVAVWNTLLTDDECRAVSSGTAPLQVQSDSLLAYYPLHGDDTTPVDASGNGLHGTITGTLAQAEAPPVGH